MKKIAIIDYGMCNLDSIARVVEVCGGESVVTSKKEDIASCGSIIIPGVGAFSDAMANIYKPELFDVLQEEVTVNKTPLLGICLGMQLLGTRGFEGGESMGLGWIEGDVVRLEPMNQDTKVPHIGWNEVNFVQSSPLLDNLESGEDFYFVHSFHLACKNKEDILTHTPYCGQFVSAVARDNVMGVQFHPEKSQRFGQQMIRNFLEF